MMFVSGVLLGVAGTVIFVKQRITAARMGGAEYAADRMMGQLESALDLNSAQYTAVEPVILSLQRELLALRAQRIPQARALVEHAVREIEKELKSEQRKILAERWLRTQLELSEAEQSWGRR